MRQQIVRYILNVLLFGLSTRTNKVNGFAFNFSPSSPPSIPLSVAANSPFPFGFPSGCGAAPYCPPPTIVLASPFPSPQPFFPSPFPAPFPSPYPSPYPPPFPYPYPPVPYPYSGSDSKQTLFSSIFDAILSKKSKPMPQSPYPKQQQQQPPAMMMQYLPQHSRIHVHLIRDSTQDHKKNHQYQNHWHEDKPKWN